MAEYEELRLTVVLVDNASEGLAKLRQSLAALGTNSAELEKMGKQLDAVTNKLRPLTEQARRTSSEVTFLTRTFATMATTVTTMVVANFGIDALKKFTDEMVRLYGVSRQIGIGSATIKNLVDQMKEMGVEPGAATNAISSFTRAIEEMSRMGSQARLNLMQGAMRGGDPDAMRAFIARVTGFVNRGEMEAAINEVIDAANNVFESERRRTGSDIMASATRNRFLQQLGLDDATMALVEGKFKRMTDTERREHLERMKIARQFAAEWARSQTIIDNLVSGIQTGLIQALRDINKELGETDKNWAKAFGESIAADIKKITDEIRFLINLVKDPGGTISKGFMEQAKKAHPSVQGMLRGMGLDVPTTEENKKYWEGAGQKKSSIWDNPFRTPTEEEARAHGMELVPKPPPAAPQKAPGASGWRLPMISPISYSESSNNESAVRVIELGVLRALQEFARSGTTGGGGGGGTSGVQNASYSPDGGGGGGGGGFRSAGGFKFLGNGNVSLPGGGGGPIRVPDGFGGGGGAPYGSSVGPGTGTGAGDTPAGAGGASGGGGAGGGAAWDRMVKGTALEGRWGEIVDAAKANNMPPEVLGGIIAHETGRGANTRGNNVAGLMDPATGMARKQQFGSISEGISAAGRTAGRHYARAGGDIGVMGQRYAPVGAANDPSGLNRSWAGGVTKYSGQLSAGSAGPTDSPAGPAGRTPQDGEVGPGAALALARQHMGEDEIRDTGKLSQFFASKGIRINPATTAWCAAFVNANLKASGVRGTGSLAAGSFTRWGQGVGADQGVQAGDVGVVRGRSPRTGIEGTHVGFLSGRTRINAAGQEEVEMIGGNQGGTVSGRGGVSSQWRTRSSLHVRRATDDMVTGRRMMDGAMGREITSRVEGTGKLSVDVRAPRGTKVDAEGGGIFKNVEMNRQTQMEPAKRGPNISDEAMTDI